MKNLKISRKQIIFISLGISLFNFVIESTSILGIFSLFMSFVFCAAWINYLIFNISEKNAKEVDKLLSEIYFTLMLICALLFLSTILIRYSLGIILSKILLFILSPLKGFRFVLRPYELWITLCVILTGVMVYAIRKMTKND